MTSPSSDIEGFARDVRVHIFTEAATTARVPQAAEIASALGSPEDDVRAALRQLAASKVLILAPNSENIWSANPFCAVPSGFRVDALGKRYSGICIWDALGIAAALDANAVITAPCGDCGTPMKLEVRGGNLTHREGVVHFAVAAHHWWDNIGFT
jgi:hypothetical protein